MKNKPACYDKKTELLTENGWMYIKDLDLETKVATMNSINGCLEFHTPTRKLEYFYNGVMDHYKNQFVDILVTENHEMVVKNNKDKTSFSKFNTSKDITEDVTFLKGINNSINVSNTIDIYPYDVKYLSDYILPLNDDININEEEWEDEIIVENYNLFQTGRDKYPVDDSRKVTFNRENFFRLYIFLFLCAGACYDETSENIDDHYKVIVNCNSFSYEYIEHIKELLNAENINFEVRSNRITIKHYELCNFLHFSIKARFIDFNIFRSIDKIYAGIILDEIKKMQTTIKINKKLSDQLELLKLMSDNVHHFIPINIKNDRTSEEVELKVVYCLTVENNSILIRRNKKIAWCGNCKVKEGDVW